MYSVTVSATRLAELGFNVLGLQAGRKTPAYPWKGQQQERFPPSQIPSLVIGNVAIITGLLREFGFSLFVVDFDSEETFQRVYPTLPAANMIVKTPNGYHAYYRLIEGIIAPTRVRIGQLDLDTRGEGG